MENSKNGNGLQRGVKVFIGLLVLSLGEYWIAASIDEASALLSLVMIAKMLVILEYYMHIRNISDTDEGAH